MNGSMNEEHDEQNAREKTESNMIEWIKMVWHYTTWNE